VTRLSITKEDFVKGFRFLTNNRFAEVELKKAWNQIADGRTTLNKAAFNEQFDTNNFHGASTIRRA